jgi:hypothetical protein
MNIDNLRIVLTIVFIVLYFWASKIVDTKEIIGIKKYSGILGHTEGGEGGEGAEGAEGGEGTNWILDSNVCPLGKVVFFLWTIVLLINLFMPLNKKLLYFLAFLTILITAILNLPLFIRAIPAFIVLLLLVI